MTNHSKKQGWAGAGRKLREQDRGQDRRVFYVYILNVDSGADVSKKHFNFHTPYTYEQ